MEVWVHFLPPIFLFSLMPAFDPQRTQTRPPSATVVFDAQELQWVRSCYKTRPHPGQSGEIIMSDRDTQNQNEASQKPNDTLGEKVANAFDGHDDPKRGPIDRLANAIDGTDDPNKGPIDRTANALDGRDDPERGPVDRAQNAIDGTDDPNKGPVDRAANALDGRDYPNRGVVDRAANAVDGKDDPNRGPLDRA